jgi:tetratricopeptide (TPR) repeat protein
MFALILMIRNEEKILKRCLEAVENVVDCFCICDTGSTDKSVEIAKEFLKTHKGCLTHEPWKNFGYNRTVSFVNAQKFIKKKLKWDTSKVYGLLLDADMVFVSKNLKEQNLTEIGYKIIQINGCLEYYNCRFVRMDYAWKCVGVTHEYWDGPTINLPKSICYIDDVNDGGCKNDKYERDEKLLRQGLVDEPENVRYLFYLAQTLKCCRRYEESIKFYKKRIKAGGWHEEVWYSYYMIGECYLNLKNIINFEKWMQLAYQYHPARSESLNKLTEHYRIHGLHHKAFHYARVGDSVPFPKNDILFVESHIYNGKFLYEKSILDYYVNQDKKIGLRDSINYLLKNGDNTNNVISNLKFYIAPLQATITKLDIPLVFGDNFTPSAISLHNYPYANVRFVNYLPPLDGGYRTRDGAPIQTKNAYMNLDTKEFSIIQEPNYLFETHIQGLEDLRLYTTISGNLCFTATSYKQFIHDKIGIVHGEYDLKNKSYKNYRGIHSPTNSDCEKNWVSIPETDNFIYSWNPLRIGKIQDDKFIITTELSTPPLFSLFRGSAPPIEVNGKWLVLVHFVEYCQPRNYYHCFVELEKETYKVLRVSLPFTFQSTKIEYCISVRLVEDCLEFFASFTDTNPSTVRSKLSELEWIEISKPTLIKPNVIRLLSNAGTYWDGDYSKCLANNEIEKYVTSKKSHLKFLFSTNDGILGNDEFNRVLNDFGKQPGKLQNYEMYRKIQSIVCTLCTRDLDEKNVLLVPFDDDTFRDGLTKVLSKFRLPSWEERLPFVFWRGGSSGYDRPETIRMKVVSKLLDNKNCNVKLTKWGNWESEHSIPESYFGDRCGLNKHFLFKYLLIVDGACIASNHQWVFGSGSVPIMVTHPKNNWWFKKYLVPMKHYVPVSYDLSDLEEKIQWLFENDDKAKEIVKNALEFSSEIISPEFQKKYIDEEVERIIQDLS